MDESKGFTASQQPPAPRDAHVSGALLQHGTAMLAAERSSEGSGAAGMGLWDEEQSCLRLAASAEEKLLTLSLQALPLLPTPTLSF